MGGPKALLPWEGRPLLLRHVEALEGARLKVRVVLGAGEAELRPLLPATVEARSNPLWAESEMGDSLRLGLADLPAEARVLVMPVDMPPPPVPLLRALCRVGEPVVPSFRGEDGHPVVLRVGALGEGTMREALAGARRLPCAWPGVVANFNHPAELRAWQIGDDAVAKS